MLGLLLFIFYQNDKEEKARQQYYNNLKQQMKEEKQAVEMEIASAHETLQSKFSTYLPGIVCWGDSLTAGAGGNGMTYPMALASRIRENLVEKFDAEQMANSSGRQYLIGFHQYSLETVDVVNMGVGGENTGTILGRNGAIPFVVEDGFTVPADSAPVEIHFKSRNGKNVAPLRQGEKGLEFVSINGIEGALSIEQESGTSEKYAYYFSRNSAGESQHVEAGTEIITSGSTQCLNYIPVIFIGQNGGYDDAAELIAQQRAIIGHQKMDGANQGKFIIIGLHTGTAAARSELETAMRTEYGDQYINLREYMSKDALRDAGIDATAEDKEMMSAGMIPKSLLSDGVHFNECGYELIGNLIYERMGLHAFSRKVG